MTAPSAVTDLLGGPYDGTQLDLVCVEGDTITVNRRARYVGTGERTTWGHWVAVHDALDPRASRAARTTVPDASAGPWDR